jgi:3-phosphoshikimate 1-carboxyvinyltransferase
MTLSLQHPTAICQGELTITGSKSESNRLLILQALYPQLTITNLSNSDDTQVLQKALSSTENIIDIHHAGTAMRFLTAYFAAFGNTKRILTGSQRMQERPIEVLVDALQKMGAQISYAKTTGYPPLEITPTLLNTDHIALPASVSSQYITALMLIGGKLPNGLRIDLEGTITSIPYIQMTSRLMERMGMANTFVGNTITVAHTTSIALIETAVESDWSSASYLYSILAIAKSGSIRLSHYRKDSLQGDAVLQKIYRQLGVASQFDGDCLVLTKIPDFTLPEELRLDLVNAPDIAQTIAVSCVALGVGCTLTGLHTLKIKETDRLVALQNELQKLGAQVQITHDSLHLHPHANLRAGVSIATYKDHRMALAFAPLALKVPLSIQEANVVSKSYPTYWDDLRTLQFDLEGLPK